MCFSCYDIYNMISCLLYYSIATRSNSVVTHETRCCPEMICRRWTNTSKGLGFWVPRQPVYEYVAQQLLSDVHDLGICKIAIPST